MDAIKRMAPLERDKICFFCLRRPGLNFISCLATVAAGKILLPDVFSNVATWGLKSKRWQRSERDGDDEYSLWSPINTHLTDFHQVPRVSAICPNYKCRFNWLHWNTCAFDRALADYVSPLSFEKQTADFFISYWTCWKTISNKFRMKIEKTTENELFFFFFWKRPNWNLGQANCEMFYKSMIWKIMTDVLVNWNKFCESILIMIGLLTFETGGWHTWWELESASVIEGFSGLLRCFATHPRRINCVQVSLTWRPVPGRLGQLLHTFTDVRKCPAGGSWLRRSISFFPISSFSLSISLHFCLSHFLPIDAGLCWILSVLVSVLPWKSIIENDECFIIISDTSPSPPPLGSIKSRIELSCWNGMWNDNWVVSHRAGSVESIRISTVCSCSTWFFNLVALISQCVCVCVCQCLSVCQCVSVCALGEDKIANVDYKLPFWTHNGTIRTIHSGAKST